MNYYYGMAWLLGLFLWQSPLYSQSVNLDSFQQIQALNIQNCAVVQVNASWNYKNRVKIEKLSKLCYVGEVDLSNKQIGAVIQKEWNIRIVPTIMCEESHGMRSLPAWEGVGAEPGVDNAQVGLKAGLHKV